MSKIPKSSANPPFGPKNANVSNYIHRFAQKNPFAIAVISDGKAASFETLNGYVWKAVHRLEKAGLEAGATAGFRFNDQFLHLVFVLAALRRGIAHVSIYAGWPDKLANGFAKQAGADIIFADQAWPNGDAETHTVSLDSLTEQSGTADISLRDIADDVPILFTLGSGTTGKQRIIYYDTANLGAMIRRDLRVRPIGFQERFYSMVLFDYFTGKRRTLGCLAAGGTVVFEKGPALLPQCAIGSASIICPWWSVTRYPWSTISKQIAPAFPS